MEKIKLVAVLAEIEQPEADGQLRTFTVRYVKKNGEVGEKLRVRKSGGVPQVNGTTAATITTERGKFRYNVKEKGVLLLTNVDTHQPFAVIIAYLTHYNGIRVWH